MPTRATCGGPLDGMRVLEIASIGPGPYCAMLLSDLGAEVLRLDRIATGAATPQQLNPMNRGRRSVAIDLKAAGASELVLDLAEGADILIEGFRPGVMERLGLGPEQVLARNPKIIYGRMTGWGQTGPRASLPGHDINYIATTGVLAGIGPVGQAPVPPLNLIGDFGGALFLAFGLVSAVYEASKSGKGQVVDAAMSDTSANMMTMFTGMAAAGQWTEHRGTNFLDGGAPYYRCYETADGKHVAVGAVETQFFAELVRRLGLPESFIAKQNDRDAWDMIATEIANVIRTRSRDEWAEVFAEAETCISPVLSLSEAPSDPHNQARDLFSTLDGICQPAPAPRFSRTPGHVQGPPRRPGVDTMSALVEWGCERGRISRLLADRVLYDVSNANGGAT